MSTLKVAVLGLGEAGSPLAVDLAAAGADVRGYDPEPARGPDGIARAHDTESAVAGREVVLSVNAAKVALGAAQEARPALRPGMVYADLNTASPALKREVAAVVAETGARFADVALLGAVPVRGLATRTLASGEGARAFADALGPLGMPVEVLSEQAGDAATLKLVRSVFMKGLAACAIESMQAAEAADCAEWLESELEAVIGEPLLERLLEGSRMHAARRVDEMKAACDLIVELGVEPRVAAASMSLLTELAEAER